MLARETKWLLVKLDVDQGDKVDIREKNGC